MSITNLNKLTKLCKQYGVYELCRPVLEIPKFAICSGSGSPHSHHYGDEGLVEHTLEVVELCLHNNKYFAADKVIDYKKLVVAAFFHDVGKIHDYQREERVVWSATSQDGETKIEWKKGFWTCSPHKRLIHHISRSVMMFNEAANLLDNVVVNDLEEPLNYTWLTDDVKNEIIHAILAHHGAKEYGSPVLPQTRLAWLLHLCDGISARMDDCLRRSK